MKNLEVPLQVAITTWFNNIQRKYLNSKLNIKPRCIVGCTVEHCSFFSDTRVVVIMIHCLMLDYGPDTAISRIGFFFFSPLKKV
jgi:hypothetical protein